MIREWIKATLSVIVISSVLYACTSQLVGPDGQPTTEQAVLLEANALMSSWKQQIAALEAKPDLSPKEQGQLAEYKGYVATGERLMAEVTTPEGTVDVGKAVSAGTMFLPPPWNIPATVLAGGVIEWLRGRKKRKSFQKLVEAINATKSKNESFAVALDTVGPDLRSAMGETAAAEVDRVRKHKMNILRDW
jgi:hypothetical protein